MGDFSFPKSLRLNSEKLTQELFNRGSSFYVYPFKVVFLPHPDQDYPEHQFLISVSARNFKRAVDRNKIKRRVREGLRLNLKEFKSDKKWLIAYIYTAKEILHSKDIHKKIVQSFSKIV